MGKRSAAHTPRNRSGTVATMITALIAQKRMNDGA